MATCLPGTLGWRNQDVGVAIEQALSDGHKLPETLQVLSNGQLSAKEEKKKKAAQMTKTTDHETIVVDDEEIQAEPPPKEPPGKDPPPTREDEVAHVKSLLQAREDEVAHLKGKLQEAAEREKALLQKIEDPAPSSGPAGTDHEPEPAHEMVSDLEFDPLSNRMSLANVTQHNQTITGDKVCDMIDTEQNPLPVCEGEIFGKMLTMTREMCESGGYYVQFEGDMKKQMAVYRDGDNYVRVDDGDCPPGGCRKSNVDDEYKGKLFKSGTCAGGGNKVGPGSGCCFYVTWRGDGCKPRTKKDDFGICKCPTDK